MRNSTSHEQSPDAYIAIPPSGDADIVLRQMLVHFHPSRSRAHHSHGVIVSDGDRGHGFQIDSYTALNVGESRSSIVTARLDSEGAVVAVPLRGHDAHGFGNIIGCLGAQDTCWLDLGFLQRCVG